MKSFAHLLSISVLFCSLITLNVTAQGVNKPVTQKYERLYVGNKLPDLPFKNLINYSKKDLKVSDLKGKLVILDFWSTGCSSCIEAFPKMEKLQKDFDGKLQILVVNPWENKAQIEKQFNRWMKGNPHARLSTLPGVNGDTTWTTLFPMNSVPTHVWIDGTGTILAITGGHNATPEHVQALLDGKKLPMSLKDDIAYNENSALLKKKGWLQGTLPDMPPVYYSAFIPYFPARGDNTMVDSAKGIFRVCPANNETVFRLFSTAFRDKNYSTSDNQERWLIEVKNKEQYEYPEDHNLLDSWLPKYCFSYEIQGPLKEKNNWASTMQQDVNRFIGSKFGLQGNMEKRKFKALVLVKTKEGAVPQSPDASWKFNYTDSLMMLKGPFKYVMSCLRDYAHLENLAEGRVLINETGIDPEFMGNMYIKGDIKKMSLEDMRKQFQQFGLDLIETEREVELLVIKEVKSEG